MRKVVLWALATGFVAGAVWFAIISLRRHTEDAHERPVLERVAQPRTPS